MALKTVAVCFSVSFVLIPRWDSLVVITYFRSPGAVGALLITKAKLKREGAWGRAGGAPILLTDQLRRGHLEKMKCRRLNLTTLTGAGAPLQFLQHERQNTQAGSVPAGLLILK